MASLPMVASGGGGNLPIISLLDYSYKTQGNQASISYTATENITVLLCAIATAARTPAQDPNVTFNCSGGTIVFSDDRTITENSRTVPSKVRIIRLTSGQTLSTTLQCGYTTEATLGLILYKIDGIGSLSFSSSAAGSDSTPNPLTITKSATPTLFIQFRSYSRGTTGAYITEVLYDGASIVMPQSQALNGNVVMGVTIMPLSKSGNVTINQSVGGNYTSHFMIAYDYTR